MRRLLGNLVSCYGRPKDWTYEVGKELHWQLKILVGMDADSEVSHCGVEAEETALVAKHSDFVIA